MSIFFSPSKFLKSDTSRIGRTKVSLQTHSEVYEKNPAMTNAITYTLILMLTQYGLDWKGDGGTFALSPAVRNSGSVKRSAQIQ